MKSSIGRLTLLAFSVSIAFSQTNFKWTKNTVALPSESELHIVLAGGQPCHSVVGVRVDASAEPSLSLTEVALERPGDVRDMAFRRISRATSMSTERFSVEGSTIRVVCDGNPDAVLNIYVSTRQPINISVSNPSGAVANLAVHDGVVIRDGVAVHVKPVGMHQLIMEAVSPLTGSSASSTFHAGDTVSLTELKSHIRTYSEPKLSLSGTQATAGVLRLQIDETGRVADVSGPSVALLDAQALQTIRTWVFQPFTMAGSVTKATGTIPFRIAADGRVSSALAPDAQVH